MFDIAWTELMIIAALAIIFVGPKELPRLMRTLGIWMRKARALAAEFRAGLDDIAREAEMDELAKTVREVREYSPKKALKKAIDPEGTFEQSIMPQGKVGKAGTPSKKPETKAAEPEEKSEAGNDKDGA